MQNQDPAPIVMPPDLAGVFMRDPLSPMLKELCYAIVHRDVQISQLNSKLRYLEENYGKLKSEMIAASSPNGETNGVTHDLERVE